jgi:outer membrane murein-binding lipoprotein Lpp
VFNYFTSAQVTAYFLLCAVRCLIFYMPQAKEAQVERKLNTEVRVLDNNIATMELNLSKLQTAVRALNNRKDAAGARDMFVQMVNVQKQIGRYKRLHNICSSMLERVKEQAVMATTSDAMQQFVSVHEDLIKECSLDRLVTQYEDLQANVDGLRNNFDDMANVANQETGEPDWDEALANWLAEDEPVSQQLTPPAPEIIVTGPSVSAVAATLPTVPRRTGGPPRLKEYSELTVHPSTSEIEDIKVPVIPANDAIGPVELDSSASPATSVRNLQALFGDVAYKKNKLVVTD